MQNPVNKRYQHAQTKPSRNSLTAEGPIQEVYECVTEPINDAEINLDQDEFGLVPYAIHDFTEESQQLETNVAAGGKSGPAVSTKARKKGNKNRRSMSESNKAEIAIAKPSKPPTAKKTRAPLKPTVHARTSSASAQPLKGPAQPQVLPLQPPGGYSELDKKASYAILEPHIPEKGEEKALTQSESKEAYRHLNY